MYNAVSSSTSHSSPTQFPTVATGTGLVGNNTLVSASINAQRHSVAICRRSKTHRLAPLSPKSDNTYHTARYLTVGCVEEEKKKGGLRTCCFVEGRGYLR
jgi:hypothetical protein